MSTKLLRQIKNSLPDLRKSEKIVGEYILKDPKSIITMKTAEASEAMGISEPTLIRFCKAIGFSGFQELKINLSQQLAADDYFVMYEINEDDSIHELCEKVFVRNWFLCIFEPEKQFLAIFIGVWAHSPNTIEGIESDLLYLEIIMETFQENLIHSLRKT